MFLVAYRRVDTFLRRGGGCCCVILGWLPAHLLGSSAYGVQSYALFFNKTIGFVHFLSREGLILPFRAMSVWCGGSCGNRRGGFRCRALAGRRRGADGISCSVCSARALSTGFRSRCVCRGWCACRHLLLPRACGRGPPCGRVGAGRCALRRMWCR